MTSSLFSSLEIRQFRRFEHLTIERLGKVNLIVGKNNVGKSTLLEALNLYANLGAPQVIQDLLKARDDLDESAIGEQNRRNGGGPAVWSLFHGHRELNKIDEPIGIGPVSSPDSTLSIGIEWFSEQIERDGGSQLRPTDVTPDGDALESIPALAIRIGGHHRILRLDRSFQSYCRRWRFQPKAFLDLATNCVHVGPHGLSPGQLERMWGRVALTDLEKEVVEALRVIAPSVDDFALLNRPGSSRDMIVRIRPEKSNVPESLRCMGDGMNRVFGIGMGMVNAKGGLLLLDEIENGIHYSVLPELWRFVAKLANKLDVQVFATSHSWDSIEAFQKVTAADKEIDGVLIRLEAREQKLRAVVFDEDKLQRFVKDDIEVR
jgi:hypothetical protein